MPVTPEAVFDAALRDLARDHHRIGLAVSGGGDSMALLHLAQHWARGNGVTLSCVTVDHGLRAGAAAEAAMVADQCAILAISHHTLHWTGWDRQGNLQDAARQARRSLIRDWAMTHDISLVLLGHTADDQAETVLMRLARGSGVDGLAGMAAYNAGTPAIFRPLLGLHRQTLRDWLTAQGVTWADDPSNDDSRYDRIKARQMLGHLASLGLTPDRLLQTAEHMQAAQRSLRRAAADFATSHVTQDRGDLRLSPAVLDLAHGDTERRVFAAALGWVGSSDYRPRFDALGTLAAQLRRGQGGTLSGCLLTRDGDMIRITREAQAVQGVQSTPDQIWDRRWHITGPATGGETVRALGQSGLRLCPDWRDSGLPAASLTASPAIWQGETLLAAPLAGFNPDWTAQIVADFHTSLLSH